MIDSVIFVFTVECCIYIGIFSHSYYIWHVMSVWTSVEPHVWMVHSECFNPPWCGLMWGMFRNFLQHDWWNCNLEWVLTIFCGYIYSLANKYSLGQVPFIFLGSILLTRSCSFLYCMLFLYLFILLLLYMKVFSILFVKLMS